MSEIFTIPPEIPFTDALARGLLDEADGDGFWASDTVVLLPTRRACRGLRDAFLDAAGGRALILPKIQPIGDVDADELLSDPVLDLQLPPAIGRTRRLLLLARLLEAHDPHAPVEHRLRLADELAHLLDELASERKDLRALGKVVPDHLSEHFRVTRELLELIDRSWPLVLADEGALDPAERRNRLLDGFAARLVHEMPERRIVVAGTTGSIDATRRLLSAVLGLPNGAIVLPGLDRELDEDTWATLPPGHPQSGLKQLLDALGRPRTDVVLWPAAAANAPARDARTALLREVMRPALTGGPALASEPDVIDRGRAGLEVMVLPDQASEAATLALRMRAVLEDPGATAILVSPDRALARRVRIELRRFGLEVDDSAGVPLDLTLPGSLLLLSARLLAGVTPVALLALLKHPLVRLGRPDGETRRDACRLERQALRGPRISGGFRGILTELRRLADELARRDPERAGRHDRSIRLVERLQTTAHPFLDYAHQPTVALDLVLTAHLGFVEALARPPKGEPGDLWAHEAGEAAADLVRDLLDGAAGYPIAPLAYPALLAQLAAARPVRSRAPRHPRLRLYGQLEARLQQADVVLIGGLNEGTWPPAVEPGPWLNRTMRKVVGLPPLERRIGLAAHDFQQLAAAPRVVLTRAERDAAGNPTVPSRWLVRLQTLFDRAERSPEPGWWAAWARQLAEPAGIDGPAPQPRPAPPVHARPRELSVSDVGLWMREPYALYAKRILGLRPLAPLEQEPGALERGVMIHGILERFVSDFPDALPDDAWDRLIRLGRHAFQAYAHRPLVQALWWPRFEQAARWYLAMEKERRDAVLTLQVEVEGRMAIERPGGPFVLKARADRIERGRDGRLLIIDYKTGTLPRQGDVTSGREPQLPLEAAMVEAGAFEDVTPAPIAGLWFWSIKGDSAGGDAKQIRGEVAEEARRALEGLAALIDHYDRAAISYPARLRADMSFVRDYDHLARFKEWAG